MINNITVKNTDGYIMPWDREVIVKQIVKETKLSVNFYNKPAATIAEAQAVAQKAEDLILKLNIRQVSGPLIREVVNSVLLEEGKAEWRNIMTRVGASVYDAYEIDSGYGFEANDNANQLNNAETSHKRKADKMSKEQNLLLMPEKLANLHLSGTQYIHDLEYFGTRPFCQDWDARYCFYYGLMPDGVGTQSSIAKPSLKAEVAILHLVKLLGAAQTNFAGGQGLYNFLTFLAPYFEGKTEKEIKQLMQMFVYEMMQMMCARGGQSLAYEECLVIRRRGVVSRVQIGELCSQYTVYTGSKKVSDGTEILSLNKKTHSVEWKPLTAVHRHAPASKTVKTTLVDGRSVVTTSDHSLFTLTDDSTIVEISPASHPDKIVTAHFMVRWDSSKIQSEIEMSSVARITEVNMPEYVYDVSVQDNENFVLANGIVAHNTVFSSVQLTPGVNNLWKDKPVVAMGKVFDGVNAPLRTYGEFEREVRLGFKALMDVMIEGDAIGKPFGFRSLKYQWKLTLCRRTKSLIGIILTC